MSYFAYLLACLPKEKKDDTRVGPRSQGRPTGSTASEAVRTVTD